MNRITAVAVCTRAIVISFALLVIAAQTTIQTTAQSTFEVRVATKTSEHPWFGQGWPEGFIIDGVQGRTLTLERGVTYSFAMQAVPQLHPFYLSTSSSGAGQGILSEGVSGNFATGNQTVTFTPTDSTPDIIYYQCSSHDFMGGQINIVSATSAESDTDLPTHLTLKQNYPNPFNPGTVIRFQLSEPADASVAVYDLFGRRVMTRSLGRLPSGQHEVRWEGTGFDGLPLPSGPYVYQVTAGTEQTSRVMILAR